jgi:integrase
MPALCKRRNERRWRGKIVFNGKTQKTKWFGSGRKGGKEYRKAVLWEEKERKKLLTKEGTVIPTISLTIREWINSYLNDVQRRFTKGTYQEKCSVFKRLKFFCKPDLPITSIDVELALKMIQKQFDTRSGYAANKDRKNLGSAWNWGMKYLPGFPDSINPFLKVERYPEIRNPRYVPPEEDFWKVFDLTQGQDRIMLTSYLHLAARRKELFRLKWTDIDWNNNQLRLFTRKTRSSSWKCDWIPLTSELKSIFIDWHKQQPVKSEFVFVCLHKYEKGMPHTHYGEPFQYRGHFMKKLCDKAKIKPFGFHAIRHLSATILYKSGYKVSTIQRILRHESPTTTEQYLKSLGFDEEIIEAVEVFSNRNAASKIVAFPGTKKRA